MPWQCEKATPTEPSGAAKTHTTHWPVGWLFEGSVDEATVLRQLIFELQLSASLTYAVKA